ncbi:MAG TPA: NADP-dependent oxidoreductase [Solirubrobacteraceae bacterium]|nr:NADP-dependent oxidoreductase [Solirubrobacteraceae bacterium]
MRAVRFHEYGDFDVLAVEEVAAPEPEQGQLSVRVRAAGVNPIDWKVLHGLLAGGKPLGEPRGLGVDLAGVVERVGEGVEGLAPGDEVLGASITPAYAELALSTPQMLIRKPPGLSFEVAGGLAVVVGTAYATLDRLALEPGETLLIAGASGAVGSVAVQLAVARGVRVVGTAGEAKLEGLRALGATAVAYGDGLLERLREAAPEGIDAALDTSGHGELEAAVELAGGTERVLTIAGSAQAAELGVRFHAGGGGELTIPALQEVVPLIESGRFSFPVAGVYALEEAGAALRESEHGRPAGKLVIVP